MNSHGNEIAIFAGNSNKPLAEAIAKELGTHVQDAEVKTFSDGEISVTIPETVRGKDVFIIQSTSYPCIFLLIFPAEYLLFFRKFRPRDFCLSDE
mgnify:CR=1 FL=1